MMSDRQRNLLGILALLLIFALPAASLSETGRRIGAGAVAPFVSLWHWSGNQLVRTWRMMPWSWDWRDEKVALEARIQELEADLATVKTLKQENQELRRLLQVGDFPGWHVVTAAVIAREPSSWNEGFVINKGTADGIAVGLVAMAGGQVVGRIVSCERKTARVALLSSPDCRISVQVGETDVIGVCTGEERKNSSRPQFVVEFLPRELELEPDMIFRTSGMGNWMPPGLMLGKIVPNPDGSLGTEVNHAGLKLRGEPLENLGIIRFVQILTAQ